MCWLAMRCVEQGLLSLHSRVYLQCESSKFVSIGAMHHITRLDIAPTRRDTPIWSYKRSAICIVLHCVMHHVVGIVIA